MEMKTKEEQALQILKSVLKTDDVDATVSQQNCPQWDSIAHLNIIIELESQFGLSLEPDEIAQITSFQDIMRVLEQNAPL